MALLAAASGDARVLAGGTDLLVQLRAGLIEPELVVDVKRIPEVHEIAAENGGFRIGAAVTGAELGEHAEVEQAVAGRGRGGRADRLDPDPGPRHHGRQPVQRLAGRRQRAGDDRGRRDRARSSARAASASCRSRRSCIAPGKTSLAKGEIVASVFLPARPPRSGDAYLRFIPRTEMDIAVVGAGVSLTLDERGTCTAARVGLGAVAPRPLLVTEAAEALIGTQARRRRARAPRRGRVGRLPADRRQARHHRIPDQGRGRAGAPRGARSRSRARGRTDGEDTTSPTTVNGDAVEFLCEPEQTLLDVLRDELRPDRQQGRLRLGRLRRLQRACSTAGWSAPAWCSAPRPRAARSRPSRAWRTATSCIRCSRSSSSTPRCSAASARPGFLIAAKALLDRNPDPSETEVRYWLAGNLCRCTGYDKIVRAVLDTAAEMRGS